jgi:hypothetical protein
VLQNINTGTKFISIGQDPDPCFPEVGTGSGALLTVYGTGIKIAIEPWQCCKVRVKDKLLKLNLNRFESGTDILVIDKAINRKCLSRIRIHNKYIFLKSGLQSNLGNIKYQITFEYKMCNLSNGTGN